MTLSPKTAFYKPGSPIISVSAVVALLATWWITEAIPIPATALVPIAIFPLLGIRISRRVVVVSCGFYFVGMSAFTTQPGALSPWKK